jgi:hypothetical protein
MKVIELIFELEKMSPEKEVIFWDGEDNHDIRQVSEDEINNLEVVLNSANCLGLDDYIEVPVITYAFIHQHTNAVMYIGGINLQEAEQNLFELVEHASEWVVNNKEGENDTEG